MKNQFSSFVAIKKVLEDWLEIKFILRAQKRDAEQIECQACVVSFKNIQILVASSLTTQTAGLVCVPHRKFVLSERVFDVCISQEQDL